MRIKNHMRPWETSVYNAQCRTWAKAKELLGIHGDAQRCDIAGELREPSPRFAFRMLPQYRTKAANQLRRDVAHAIRDERNAVRDGMLRAEARAVDRRAKL